jgi:hypothetical protein
MHELSKTPDYVYVDVLNAILDISLGGVENLVHYDLAEIVKGASYESVDVWVFAQQGDPVGEYAETLDVGCIALKHLKQHLSHACEVGDHLQLQCFQYLLEQVAYVHHSRNVLLLGMEDATETLPYFINHRQQCFLQHTLRKVLKSLHTS